MSTRVHWRGPQVKAAAMRAAQGAIDEVTEDAALSANQEPDWIARHRGQEGAIDNEPARRLGNTVVGKFGLTRRSGKRFDIFLAFGRPFLRPAADRTFPRLAAAIKRRIP